MLLLTLGLGEVTGSAFVLQTVVSSGTFITATFAADLVLAGDALDPTKWIITGGDDPVTVTGISYLNNTVILDSTAQRSDVVYTLELPATGIRSATDDPFYGPYTMTFQGYNTPPTVLMARSLDARLLEVIFSEAVSEGDALDSANYSIDNGLLVISSSRVTPSVYHLVTSRQTTGVVYTVTVSNIRDTGGEPIA